MEAKLEPGGYDGKETPLKQDPRVNKPTWPELQMPKIEKPTKARGSGAAIRGTSFGKNG